MAYSFSVNNTPATGAVAMYSLISTLITAGWTKSKDSDGTTYSSSGVQVSSGAAGANGLGNTSAWVVLIAPSVGGQTRSLCIQRGATNPVWRIKYSAAAAFTGGSPAAAQVPSATDEVTLLGAGTDASPTYTTWFAADAGYRWNVACGGASESYAFYAFAFSTGAPTTNPRLIFLDVLSVFAAGDVDPAVIGLSTAGSTAVTEIMNANNNSTNPKTSCAWMGVTSSSTNFVGVGLFTPGSLIPFGGTNWGVSPFTSKDTNLANLPWLRTAAVATPIGVKGISNLFRLNSVARTNTDLMTVSSTGDFIFFQGFLFPWNGSAPTV